MTSFTAHRPRVLKRDARLFPSACRASGPTAMRDLNADCWLVLKCHVTANSVHRSYLIAYMCVTCKEFDLFFFSVRTLELLPISVCCLYFNISCFNGYDILLLISSTCVCCFLFIIYVTTDVGLCTCCRPYSVGYLCIYVKEFVSIFLSTTLRRQL